MTLSPWQVRPDLLLRSQLIWLGLLIIVASGCLPSSCSRTESRAISAADSTSRRIASLTAVDTLRFVRTISKSGHADFEYPRTALFDAAGRLWISDTATNLVFCFDTTGALLLTVDSNLLSYPFLAGSSADSVFVFSPGRQVLQRITSGSVEDVLSTPAKTAPGLLQFASVTPSGDVFVKILGDTFTGYIASLDRFGTESLRLEIHGPPWVHAGGIRSWGDTLVSLRGYLPIVDMVLPNGTLDSLRLVGFDSPMLSRTRLFMQGQVDAPPLLAASIAPEGNEMFVLNIRPGWLRIDVYDRRGQLKTILTQPNPSFNKAYYPTDLAVMTDNQESTLIAVTVVEPVPRVDYYRWVRVPAVPLDSEQE